MLSSHLFFWILDLRPVIMVVGHPALPPSQGWFPNLPIASEVGTPVRNPPTTDAPSGLVPTASEGSLHLVPPPATHLTQFEPVRMPWCPALLAVPWHGHFAWSHPKPYLKQLLREDNESFQYSVYFRLFLFSPTKVSRALLIFFGLVGANVTVHQIHL